MKKTAFNEIHKSLGGKMVEFGGFEMPVQYSGIIEEHLAVRNGVGVFDVSHMGEFEVSGRDALAFLQKVTVNDVAKLSEGKAQYSAMCYEHGGIVDDLLVYHLGKKFMLVVNAANIQKDFAWLQEHLFGDAQLVDVSDRFSLLAIQGPKSLATLQQLTKTDLSSIPYYGYASGELCGIPTIISRTGYTGELGFEIYFDSSETIGAKIWNAVFEAGRPHGIVPVGLGARDTLRLEMGFCLYGNDIDETTHPLEAGLAWITKLGKGDFIGKVPIAKAKELGLQRKLVGLTMPDKSLARHGHELHVHGSRVGTVTSGTFSPSLQKGIAMGYIESKFAEPGVSVTVSIRGKLVAANIVKVPFVQRN
jgi:aminomethyltransferase